MTQIHTDIYLGVSVQQLPAEGNPPSNNSWQHWFTNAKSPSHVFSYPQSPVPIFKPSLMSTGMIEPFKDGFLEIIPEGEGSDYWQIAAIHINGQVFCPSPRIYSSTNAAFTKARQIFDWICNHEQETCRWICFCEELNMTLWRQPKSHPIY
jgi:hypothetical protein